MASTSPTTFGLLGMLAVRSWTGYELTTQLQRSLRFVWPSSAGHLYREQRKLADLGWATVEDEPAGQRSRKRYSITPAGEDALTAWLQSTPEEPHFEIEGMLRLFHGDHGSVDDLVLALEATAASAITMRDELVGNAAEYLEPGGPMSMLEQGVGGPGARVEWHGREMFPERLHVIALVIDGTTRLLDTLAEFSTEVADEVGQWSATTDPGAVDSTRQRLEAITTRYR